MWYLMMLLLCPALCSTLPQDGSLSITVRKRNDLATGSSCNCQGLKCGLVGRTNRVVGGSETTLTELPWIAAMFYKGKLYCGAALVSNEHLVTAAHCINRVDKRHVEIVFGSHNISDVVEAGRQTRRVGDWWAHPGFQRRSFNNDIGVIRLSEPLVLGTDVRPVCLPESGGDYVGQHAIVAGWGRVSEKGRNSEVLRKVRVPIMSNDECKTKKYRPSEITDNMVCAGYDQGKIDACQGDSGGPMMFETKNNAGQRQVDLIGVVSWGQGCARPGYPGVYTRVENFSNFLRQQIGASCLCPRN
ncbi:trypsin [Hyalella azteca]|uniref:Trypsin n=1 Tax=Hyalella azteca TaxID=294128 RepID=A0A979FHK9_HYAAZ|nr:trypsin [Hyalella azteca]